MDRKVLFDTHTGELVPIVEWDFRSLSPETFKKNFKSYIQKPLQHLLNEVNRDASVEDLPRSLKESILGLMNGLAGYYSFLLSRSDQQKMLHAHETFGSQAEPKVGLIRLGSVSKVRKTCLSIVDAKNRNSMPFILSPTLVESVERSFFSPVFASQMATVRRGIQPGFSFPILVSWSIEELGPTRCPDTFVEPKIIFLTPKAELRRNPSDLDITRTYLLETALNADESLRIYLAGTCALCKNAGVKHLQRCSKCNVARYCGREHQVEHWKEHKKHCKRLRELKDDATARANKD